MAAKTKIVDLQEVLRWFSEGRKYRWMVEQYETKYGVSTTPSMWGNIRRDYGLDRRTTQNDELLPWKLREEDRFAYPALMLRLEARRRENKEADIRPVDRGRLASWLKGLDERGVVIAYDYGDTTGFTEQPRLPEDDDIIRRPTTATGKRRATE
ncbi:hypothetical protein [Actinoplanes sp. NPDC049265]|uniref:hypothetical protein n=1 Tax=Actinoplanes sp. NPDC049265 TaxID=3363902 RepID=UPI003713E68E